MSLRGVTIARPVPFDVVIVADNSDSLSWSRDSLSAGLAKLLRFSAGVLTAQDDSLSVNVARYCQTVIP